MPRDRPTIQMGTWLNSLTLAQTLVLQLLAADEYYVGLAAE